MPARAFSPLDANSSLSVLRLVDLIPMSDSGETAQNSEPSITVNPLNPAQMFAATFGAGAANPYFVSVDEGADWSIFGTLDHNDTSSAGKPMDPRWWLRP